MSFCDKHHCFTSCAGHFFQRSMALQWENIHVDCWHRSEACPAKRGLRFWLVAGHETQLFLQRMLPMLKNISQEISARLPAGFIPHQCHRLAFPLDLPGLWGASVAARFSTLVKPAKLFVQLIEIPIWANIWGALQFCLSQLNKTTLNIIKHHQPSFFSVSNLITFQLFAVGLVLLLDSWTSSQAPGKEVAETAESGKESTSHSMWGDRIWGCSFWATLGIDQLNTVYGS